MAGLVPAIHVFGLTHAVKTWMPATNAGVTSEARPLFRGHNEDRRADKKARAVRWRRGTERAERRSSKNCESLPALLLRHFKVLRHFGETFLAVKHAGGKIGIVVRPNAGFAASA
jgi:hypothetical protein